MRVLATQEGGSGRDCLDLISQIRSSTAALELLPEREQRSWAHVFEVLEFEYQPSPDSLVSFAGIHVAARRPRYVRAALERLAAEASRASCTEPAQEWAALCEDVARERARLAAEELLRAIREGYSTERLLALHGAIPVPSARPPGAHEVISRSAAEWEEHIIQERAGRSRIRLSSGHYTLDRAMTARGEPLGFTGLGELHTIPAGTGQGKSAHAVRLAAAFAQDLQNWGLPYACGIFAHVEEEVEVKLEALGMRRGDIFAHLADTIEIVPVESSRQRFIRAVYNLVVRAEDRAAASGLPITEFLPYWAILDYIQRLADEGEPASQAVARTADLLLALMSWNPHEMAKHSGVEYRAHTGRSWPRGMESHRLAVVTYAQLRQQDGDRLYWREGARGLQREDFVYQNEDGSDCWELRVGDARIPTKDEIFGSSVLLNHSTSIVFLHRSLPRLNKKHPIPNPPYARLEDTRARYVFEKVRNGQGLKYVPMEFDSGFPTGFRGQYYDVGAERWIEEGLIEVSPGRRGRGDLILPVRERSSPLAGVRY